MTRMVAPGGCTGIDVKTEFGTTRYDGRVFDVDNRAHIRMLKDEGAFVASTGGVTRAVGFPCSCGFTSYFRHCSRCGRDNPRET